LKKLKILKRGRIVQRRR